MYTSYFKVGWRNLLKNKGYSAINIIGLASGMTVALLIGLWVADELSFDSYFQNHERLARVMIEQTHEGQVFTGGTVSIPMGEGLRTRYASDFKAVSLASWNNDHIIMVGDKKLRAPGMWVQKDFPEMFTLKMQRGPRDGLKDPSTILLAESFAKALFGDADPVNQTVRIDNKFDLRVGGIYEDLPRNTNFYNTKFLLPWENNENWLKVQTAWDNHCAQLYVELNDHADVNAVSAKIKTLPTPHIKHWKEEIMLHPMDRLHLYDEFENGVESGGQIQFVWLFSTIGVFVLLLACINFMNLSTARSEHRAKEVGIRKTIGSVKSQLIAQFLSESLLVALLSFVLSLVFAQLSLPFFNAMADKQTVIPWRTPLFWMAAAGFTLTAGVIAGSYPAFYLSAIKPIKVLKGTFRAGRLALLPRKVLVVVQFTVSITLIVGTLIVYNQIEYAKNRPVGYSRAGLITVPISTDEMKNNFEAIRQELLQGRAVENVSAASSSPASFNNNTAIEWRGKDPALVIFFQNVTVTHDFGSTIAWTIKDGRDFSREFASDSSAIILNEAAVKATGLKNPVGEWIKYNGKKYTVIGVVKDMLASSPYNKIEPAFFYMDGWLSVITIRINPETPVREALTSIESVFKKYNPNAPFDFWFVDEEYEMKFASEERIGSLAAVFAVLAIFISCLGLFGLSSFVAEQRTKEIGIRKVLGATVTSLWRMLSKDFVILVIIASLISVPISFYFMNTWLQDYNYRITVTWHVFAVAGVGALVITLLTVSFQAIKAALANPVRSLRSE